jgi:hypothetical protein
VSEEDERSPFYSRTYSEFEFSNTIYDHFIHPQWDEIGSSTLFIKIIYVNYDRAFCIIELMGEWNDTLHNDIMFLKRNVIEFMIEEGINKFILIGENILNFHSLDNDYYQEWFDEIEDGWIVAINFRTHVFEEFKSANLDYYIAFGGRFDQLSWRAHDPNQLYERIDNLLMKRLNL